MKRGPKSRFPGAEVLERLYVDEQRSCSEIARLLDVAKPTVAKWLKKAGIQARDARTSTMLSGKYGVQNEAHREKLRGNIASIREHITPEGRKRGGEKRRGRTPPNKGKPMSEEQRQILITQRADPDYRRKAAERNSGENAWNWRGGRKTEHERHLDSAEWKRIRREVYKRDGRKCADCGCECLSFLQAADDPKRRIQAHHIVPRRLGGSDDLSNLVTLCMSCHHKRERRYADALIA